MLSKKDFEWREKYEFPFAYSYSIVFCCYKISKLYETSGMKFTADVGNNQSNSQIQSNQPKFKNPLTVI